MDMNGMSDMSGMGNMDMGDGIPTPARIQIIYWAFVAAAIAAATFANILTIFTLHQRSRAVGRGVLEPAKPSNCISTAVATFMALSREFAYASWSTRVLRRWRLRTPVLGHLSLVLGELILVLVLSFYRLDPSDEWQWENIGYRTGYVATAQLPLVFVLAGKNNIIGFLTGSSYERLNWLHRWVARILLLTATLHMAFWFQDWARYDYIKVKLTKDKFAMTGLASWTILLWIVISSLAPLRRWNYEFFVIQHVVSIGGVAAAIYLHLPNELKVWLWISLAFAVADRVLRLAVVLYVNVSIFHSKQQRRNGFWTCKAVFESVEDGVTRITIQQPPIHWKPGQHIFLSCHSVLPLQSHPFTIASLPQDQKMEFLVKAQKGGTKRLHDYSRHMGRLPLTRTDVVALRERVVAIEGPYGRTRSMRQFDSVVFFAGSTGSTFTLPLMRDIVSSWVQRSDRTVQDRSPLPATRFVRFNWIVKSRKQLLWFEPQLRSAADDVARLRTNGFDVMLQISIYVTCEEELAVADIQTREDIVIPAPSVGVPARNSSEKGDATKVATKGVVPQQRSAAVRYHTCGTNGTCCCTETIEDEDILPGSVARCKCSSAETETASVKDSGLQNTSSHYDQDREKAWSEPRSSADGYQSTLSSDEDVVEHSGIKVFTGRPNPRSIIRRALEQALGESAVVVCGPPGLVDDIRSCVVALSDERAIHKGTGAQGLYLHSEAFGY